MDRTIREGEGNCLLLVGERGIGKTAIVDRSIKVMSEVYGEDGFIAIRLSGLVQKDDKAALKEVARQLCSSAYIDESENGEGGASFVSICNPLNCMTG
jgi:predicted ATP-binding protein involved in virulence